MNYQELKNAIIEVIRTNGNEEITGEVLQFVLLEMVSSLGKDFQFAGVATPQTEIIERDDKVAWVLGAGTYENFGIPFTVAVDEIAFVLYNGTYRVQKVKTGVIVDDTLTSDGQNPVKGGAIYAEFDKLRAAGYLFEGVATPSLLPPANLTEKIFYLATQGGAYTNLDNITLTKGINIIRFDGTSWIGESLIAITDEVIDSNVSLITAAGVYSGLSGKVDKAEGMGLSQNSYTNTEKSKLGALPTAQELVNMLGGKQNVLTFDTTPTLNSQNPVTSDGIQRAIEAILVLIPSAATALNQLADKSFVNSTVATASATFRGTYNLVSDLSLAVTATHAQIAAALAGAVSGADNNDYCFVQIPTSADTPTEIRVTERYKFNGENWAYEYDLNNSGFTAAQWEAINSAITSALVTKLSNLPDATQLANLFAGKQNTLTFDNAPVSGSSNPVKSGGIYDAIAAITAVIPSTATSSNKLVDANALTAYVTGIIGALDASFDLTSTDGHVTLKMTQVDGVITTLQILTNDIASAQALTTLGGQVSTNADDIAALQALYNALQQSAPEIIQPTDTWPVANPSTTVIYRVIDRVNTPPQYYSDYMFKADDLTTPVLMATYNNAIDPRPKKASQNLVTSGGVADEIERIDDELYGELPTVFTKEIAEGYIRNITDETKIPFSLPSGTYNVSSGGYSFITKLSFYFYDSEGNNILGDGGVPIGILVSNGITLQSDVAKIGLFGEASASGTLVVSFDDIAKYIGLKKMVENIEGVLQDTDEVPQKDSQDLITSGAVYNANSIQDASDSFGGDLFLNKNLNTSGEPVDDIGSVITDFIPYDQTIIGLSYLLWIWGESLSASKYKICFYDASKNIIEFFSSLANVTERTVNMTTMTGVKYFRLSFGSDYYKQACVRSSTDPNWIFFKLTSLKDFVSGIAADVDKINNAGIERTGVYDYTEHTGTFCVKVEDFNIKAGTPVIVKISTNKDFTRFMIGFNAVLSSPSAVNYQNFYNGNTAEITFIPDVSLKSLWIYLVTAHDTDMEVTYEIKSGLYAQCANEFESDLVVLPSTTYALSAIENSIYHQNYLKYMKDSFIVTRGNQGWEYRQRRFRTTRIDNAPLWVTLLERQSLGIIRTYKTDTVVGDKDISTPKNVNVIGDSFTYNGYWYQHIANNVNGLSFVGMRKSYACQNPLRGEGRGGWSLSEYFQPHDDVSPTHMQPFSPFMHVEGYTYYGEIDFWKVIVNGTSQYPYGTNGFDDYKSWFDINGYKVNPSVNDLMYDGVNDKYVYYNGSSWTDFDGNPEFEFDYAKYVSTWNISSPDIVIVMLGKNDFQFSASDSVFNEFKDMMDTLIASVQSYAVSAGKTIIIGICTPAVANEAPNNSDSAVPEVGGRNMWVARKKMIEYYDTAEFMQDGVYIVDSGVCLDPLYGFELTEVKPYEWYTGDERELYATNGVHPSYGGYAQIGTCVGGFIQSKR